MKKLPLKFKDKYNDFFDMKNLKHVGTKIHNICQRILNNEEGISLVYSEKLYGGIFPMALALETMGFVRYDNDDFLETNKNKTKFKMTDNEANLLFEQAEEKNKNSTSLYEFTNIINQAFQKKCYFFQFCVIFSADLIPK